MEEVLDFVRDNFEPIAVLVIAAITVYYNHRSQVKLLQYNAKIKTSEKLYSEITEIRKSVSSVASSNDSAMRELAKAGDASTNQNITQAERQSAIDSHFNTMDATLKHAYETRGQILTLFESIETNAFISGDIGSAIKALRIEYTDLDESLREVHDKVIHFDVRNPTNERFQDLHREIQQNNDKLYEFGQFLDDLVVIVQNNLTGKVFGVTRKYRYLDPPRRVLTVTGIVDHRVLNQDI